MLVGDTVRAPFPYCLDHIMDEGLSAEGAGVGNEKFCHLTRPCQHSYGDCDVDQDCGAGLVCQRGQSWTKIVSFF